MSFTRQNAAQLAEAINTFLRFAEPMREERFPDRKEADAWEAAYFALVGGVAWKRVETAYAPVVVLTEQCGLQLGLPANMAVYLLQALRADPPNLLERLRDLSAAATIVADHEAPNTLSELRTCMSAFCSNSEVREQLARAIPERGALERAARRIPGDRGDLTDERTATALADQLINNGLAGEVEVWNLNLCEVARLLRSSTRTTHPGETEGPPKPTRPVSASAVEVLLGDENRQVLAIAQSNQSAGDKMEAIYNLDRRFLAWDSPQWAELLNVSAAAIRKTTFWTDGRRKAIDAARDD